MSSKYFSSRKDPKQANDNTRTAKSSRTNQKRVKSTKKNRTWEIKK
jgi:hypothetical protein